MSAEGEHANHARHEAWSNCRKIHDRNSHPSNHQASGGVSPAEGSGVSDLSLCVDARRDSTSAQSNLSSSFKAMLYSQKELVQSVLMRGLMSGGSN